MIVLLDGHRLHKDPLFPIIVDFFLQGPQIWPLMDKGFSSGKAISNLRTRGSATNWE